MYSRTQEGSGALRRPGSSRHRAGALGGSGSAHRAGWFRGELYRIAALARWAPCGRQYKMLPVGSAPFGGWRHHLPAHFVVGLWMLDSDVNLSLWQQRRENHTTGLRPEENKQTSLRSRKCTPFGASAPPFPRRGNFALRSAFGPISILRRSAAKTSPSGGGAVGRRGAFPTGEARLYGFSFREAEL